MANPKGITREEFIERERTLSDERLGRELGIETSNMEILVGEGSAEANKQKFLSLFRSSSDWEDYRKYWEDQSQTAETPEERGLAEQIARNEHFKRKGDPMCVSISIISAARSRMGKEGEYALDIHFYDPEKNPKNKGDRKRRIIGDTFDKLMEFAEANNMPYVVKDALAVYTGDNGYLVRSDPNSKSDGSEASE